MNKKVIFGIVGISILLFLFIAAAVIVHKSAYSACVRNVMEGEDPNHLLYSVKADYSRGYDQGQCYVTFFGFTWKVKGVMPLIEGPDFVP